MKNKEIIILNPAPAHFWLLNYFAPKFEWYDRLEFCINQSCDEVIPHLQKSLTEMVHRHDGLRTTFIKQDHEWKQQIHSSIPNGESLLTLCPDLSHEQELQICQSFDIHKLPLFKVLVVPIAAQKTRVVVLFHHIIIDYIGLMIFFKELCLLLNQKIPDPIFQSNSDYAKTLTESVNASVITASKEFWKDKIKGLSLNNAKPCLQKSVKTQRKVLPKELSEALLKEARKVFGVSSLHEILSAPLYRSLENLQSKDKVAISHKLHGRHVDGLSSRFFSTIGNFAINVPIVCAMKPSSSWSEVIKQIKSELDSLPKSGLTYDLTPDIPYPDHLLAPVRINFMGNLSLHVPEKIEVELKSFIKRLQHPEQPLTTFVELFLYFYEKELIIEIAYDGTFDWAETLIEKYYLHLTDLIKEIRAPE